MTDPQFFVTPGFGEALQRSFYYQQCVKIGDRIEVSGQGGWTDELDFPETIEGEILQAFDNVERTLNTAGSSWKDVAYVTSYHVPLDDSAAIETEVFDAVNAQFKERMPDRPPCWTAVAVPKLGIPPMHIEIAVTAVLAHDAA
jgi:enamine deaminase RidA (YjgF/YER057c/UK114 family)